MESDLTALLKTLCPRVFPDVAPYDTPTPYITYQHIGGDPLSYVDGSEPDLVNAEVQINTWSDTRKESLALSRAIEAALRAAAVFTVEVLSKPLGDVDDDTDRRGSLQDFSIWWRKT